MKKLLALLLALALAWPASSQAQEEAPGQLVQRLAGANRYETAVLLSQKAFGRARQAVLASGENYPDGLTGGVLASVLEGPLLLTSPQGLPASVAGELKRLGVRKVYLLGGQASISQKLEEDLAQAYEVERLSGPSRIETAQAVAEKIQALHPSGLAGLAGSESFADSLSATGLLAKNKVPLLLTGPRLAQSTQAYLDRYQPSLLLFGGTNQIPNDLRVQLSKKHSFSTYSGKNRFDTALQIASSGFSHPQTVILVNGEDYPDALAASNLAQALQAPILLTSPQQVSAQVLSYLGRAQQVLLVGGENSISQAIEDEINRYQTSGEYRVLGVEDPRTLILDIRGRKTKVQLIGIQEKESLASYSRDQLLDRQYQALEAYVGKRVRLEMDIQEKNSKDQLLAYAYLGQTMINKELLATGLYDFQTAPPNIRHDASFKSLAQPARD